MSRFVKFYIWIFSNLIYVKESATIPATDCLSQSGIVFQMEDWDNCTLNDGQQPGKCVPLEECPEALRKWDTEHIYPKTCYFIKNQQIVCCNLTERDNDQQKKKDKQSIVFRPLSKGCANVNPNVPALASPTLVADAPAIGVPAISHGLPVGIDEFPFMAVLGWPLNVGDSIWYRCGAVLITHRYVLTAAHCAELGGAPPTVVRLGGTSLTDSTIYDVKIKRFIKHPEYNATSIYHDIALVELEDVRHDISVFQGCLWLENGIPDNNVTALGYGHTSFAGQSSDQLLKASLMVIPNEECEKYYQTDRDVASSGLADTHLCAGDPEHSRDTCQGDSGGPLVMDTGKFIVGITSFGFGCAGAAPSIYTRVSSYIDWIEEVIWPDCLFKFGANSYLHMNES
ncbi:trypsin 5G1-like isoform 1-T5 [Glossina fuscipes fuscipes]